MDKQLLAKKRVLIVGDSMLDKYWFGDANRISPEAPVPVVRIVCSDERLGGAANVALNVASLGVCTTLMGVVGNDENGAKLQELLEKAGITSRLSIDADRKTILKLRIVARQQQLVRIDFEDHPSNEVLSRLLTDFSEVFGDYDVLVLSDYGKGGLDYIQSMIAMAREKGIPVLVDPKGDDYDRYAGATLITPNRAELAQVTGQWTGEEDLENRAQALRERLGLQALLLTRSEEGMTLFTQDGALTVPAQAREVFDVSGAGDTVIAVTAAMIAAGLPLDQTVQIANRAGGIVVGKLGTASVSYGELFGE